MSEILKHAEKTIDGFKEKANHNKDESLTCFILILISSLSAPLFITLGSGTFLTKILPSILSVLAGGLTSWLQLRKPQKLWSMYRGSQRMIEDNVLRYKYHVGEYKNCGDPDSLLAEKIAEICLAAHTEWVSVIPNPEHISVKNENG